MVKTAQKLLNQNMFLINFSELYETLQSEIMKSVNTTFKISFFVLRPQTFRVSYRSREILNVRQCLRVLRLYCATSIWDAKIHFAGFADKKIVYVGMLYHSRSCDFDGLATFGPKALTRRDWYIFRPWCIMYYILQFKWKILLYCYAI